MEWKTTRDVFRPFGLECILKTLVIVLFSVLWGVCLLKYEMIKRDLLWGQTQSEPFTDCHLNCMRHPDVEKHHKEVTHCAASVCGFDLVKH